MFPSVFEAFHNFFFNKDYFESLWDKWVAKVRGALLALGAAIALPGGLGEQLKQVMTTQHAMYVGVGIMGLSVMLRAGDKTPENVKALANEAAPR